MPYRIRLHPKSFYQWVNEAYAPGVTSVRWYDFWLRAGRDKLHGLRRANLPRFRVMVRQDMPDDDYPGFDWHSDSAHALLSDDRFMVTVTPYIPQRTLKEWQRPLGYYPHIEPHTVGENQITFESGIPFPGFRTSITYRWADIRPMLLQVLPLLEIGQSFYLPPRFGGPFRFYMFLRAQGRRQNRIFLSNPEGDGVRIWRHDQKPPTRKADLPVSPISERGNPLD